MKTLYFVCWVISYNPYSTSGQFEHCTMPMELSNAITFLQTKITEEKEITTIFLTKTNNSEK